MKFLQGKKTYVVALVLAALNFAVAMGWLSTDHLSTINAILVALGFGALRAGSKTDAAKLTEGR